MASRTSNLDGQGKILIVDDEWNSPIVRMVRQRLEEEGWRTIIADPEEEWRTGEEFEAAALYAI